MKKDSFLLICAKMLFKYICYHILGLLAVIGVIAFIKGAVGACIAQLFGLGIILVLPFMSIYKIGDSDYNKVQFNRIKDDPFKGLKIGLISYSPFILASVLIVLAKLGVISDAYLPFYRLINAPFMPFVQALMPTTLTLAEMSLFNVIIAALTSVLPPLALGLGYRQGLRRLDVADVFVTPKNN